MSDGGQVRKDGARREEEVEEVEAQPEEDARDLLDDVDVLATGVEAVSDRAFRVLVRQPVPHRQQHRRRRVVLAGDELQRRPLVGELGPDGTGDRRLDGLIAQAMMSIPAMKAVEIGDGFKNASLTGTHHVTSIGRSHEKYTLYIHFGVSCPCDFRLLRRAAHHPRKRRRYRRSRRRSRRRYYRRGGWPSRCGRCHWRRRRSGFWRAGWRSASRSRAEAGRSTATDRL